LLLIVGISPALLIVIDGFTFLASAVLTAQVGPQPAAWSSQRSMALQGWKSLRRGFDLLLLDPTIALFAIQAALGAMLAGVIVVYFVPIAHHSLHLPTSRVGILYVIIGAASVVGSLIAIRRPRVGRSGLISVGYFHLIVAILVGIMLGPAVVVIALVLFAGTGVMQEIWGLNRLQTTTPRDGIGQAFGSALWFQFLGRAVGAAVGAWGASHLSQSEFFYLVVVVAVLVCALTTISRPIWWRRRSTNWPPISPPLPLDP
jgi:predicted MFS family arabinose efflux permease